MQYSKAILDHLENPRNVGEMIDANAIAEVVNSACGDKIKLFIKFRDKKIISATMKAYGCVPTLSSVSFLTEWLMGKSFEEASNLEVDELINLLGGLPRGKKHAADLAIEALQIALLSYKPDTQNNS
ncbi:MAG: iron-sulfur cluster assembly scaffold protein [Acidobacteria bacterium]|nr:iron-sulfur cluster assembly scaffold protein [Acidobacteriota bacterium]